MSPFRLNGEQISKGKIRLIYPLQGTDSIAQNYLSLLSVTDTLLGKDYCLGVTKLSVIASPKHDTIQWICGMGTSQNGTYYASEHGGYAQPWSQQLAVHMKCAMLSRLFALNRNTVKFASHLFGQQATGLAAGFVPMWYLEGDAVATETAFSHE